MFLTRIFMYYCLRFPPPSFIVPACHAFFIHEFSCTIFSIYHFTWVKLASVFLFVAVRPTTSQCVHTLFPLDNVALMMACVTLFPKAFIWSDKLLIYCCCLTTVPTEITRQAANYASGPSFASVCVAAAAILSKYPSSKFIIWFVSWAGPSWFIFRWSSKYGGTNKLFSPPPGRLRRVNGSLLEGRFPHCPASLVFLEFRPLLCFCFVLTGLKQQF